MLSSELRIMLSLAGTWALAVLGNNEDNLENEDEIKRKETSFKRLCPARSYTTLVVRVSTRMDGWMYKDHLKSESCL